LKTRRNPFERFKKRFFKKKIETSFLKKKNFSLQVGNPRRKFFHKERILILSPCHFDKEKNKLQFYTP